MSKERENHNAKEYHAAAAPRPIAAPQPAARTQEQRQAELDAFRAEMRQEIEERRANHINPAAAAAAPAAAAVPNAPIAPEAPAAAVPDANPRSPSFVERTANEAKSPSSSRGR